MALNLETNRRRKKKNIVLPLKLLTACPGSRRREKPVSQTLKTGLCPGVMGAVRRARQPSVSVVEEALPLQRNGLVPLMVSSVSSGGCPHRERDTESG